jgi:hypothetical protein
MIEKNEYPRRFVYWLKNETINKMNENNEETEKNDLFMNKQY